MPKETPETFAKLHAALEKHLNADPRHWHEPLPSTGKEVDGINLSMKVAHYRRTKIPDACPLPTRNLIATYLNVEAELRGGPRQWEFLHNGLVTHFDNAYEWGRPLPRYLKSAVLALIRTDPGQVGYPTSTRNVVAGYVAMKAINRHFLPQEAAVTQFLAAAEQSRGEVTDLSGPPAPMGDPSAISGHGALTFRPPPPASPPSPRISEEQRRVVRTTGEWEEYQDAIHRHLCADDRNRQASLPERLTTRSGQTIFPRRNVDHWRDSGFPAAMPESLRDLITTYLERGNSPDKIVRNWTDLGNVLNNHFDDPNNWGERLPDQAVDAHGRLIHPYSMVMNIVVSGSYPQLCPIDTRLAIHEYLSSGAIDVAPFEEAHARLMAAGRPSGAHHHSHVATLQTPTGAGPGPATSTSATRPAAVPQWPGATGAHHPHHSR
ncbi:hypothetical protein [Micromonospora sp. SH-82]|uniref:hypothetical protein n=1 Tax=Micromonospora sp. SH-82 TaxID=3132938 RepID=UPI003EBEBC40